MVSYNLTETDIEDIEMLIRITKTIDSLYCQLYELEIYGLKDTPEYKKVLDNLNISLEVENNKYQELDLTYERCEACIKYIKDTKLPDNFSNDFASIITQDYNNRIFRRIIKTLDRKIRMLYNDKIVYDNASKYKILIGESNFNDQKRWNIEITEALEVDIYSFYLYFLKQEISSKKKKDIKDYLLFSKYYVSFIDKEVERNMVISEFDILPPIYLCTEYWKSLTNIPEVFYKSKLSGTCAFLLDYFINILLNIKDKDYQNIKNRVIFSIVRSFFRGVLALSSDGVIEEVDYLFNAKLETVDKDIVNATSKSIEKIRKIFLGVKHDKDILSCLIMKIDK